MTPCGASGSTCGIKGGTLVPAVNNGNYKCSNCGTAPCVDTNGVCWSCFDGSRCWPYRCGQWCSATPCTASTAFMLAANYSQSSPAAPPSEEVGEPILAEGADKVMVDALPTTEDAIVEETPQKKDLVEDSTTAPPAALAVV